MEQEKQDPGLVGNELIEAAIAALQGDPSEEMLAHTLTVIRRRMQESGQVIMAVEAPGVSDGSEAENGQLQLMCTRTEDGKTWWLAFTTFAEQSRGSGNVMSAFLADMETLFLTAIQTDEIDGVILNPWNRTICLDKTLMKMILGQM